MAEADLADSVAFLTRSSVSTAGGHATTSIDEKTPRLRGFLRERERERERESG